MNRLRQRRISFVLLPSAVRLSTYAMVAASNIVRDRAIVCSALFNWRSPLRLSRCRTLLPGDAGIGFTPTSAANAASDLGRPWCEYDTSTCAVVTGPSRGNSWSPEAITSTMS